MYVYTDTYTHTYITCMPMSVCKHTCMYPFICVCMYMYICICIYVCKLCIYVCKGVCILWWPVQGTRVSRDSLPLKLSPRRLYISVHILPPEDLFQNRFSPGDYILKQSLRGRELISSPVEINSPPGEFLFRHDLGYCHITFIAIQSTLFWL